MVYLYIILTITIFFGTFYLIVKTISKYFDAIKEYLDNRKNRAKKFSLTVMSQPKRYSGLWLSGNSIDVWLSGMNFTGKTIKYIHVWLTAYNPVDDVAGRSIRRKLIGKLEDMKFFQYSFEGLWFGDCADRVVISSCLVEFMDGTSKDLTQYCKNP